MIHRIDAQVPTWARLMLQKHSIKQQRMRRGEQMIEYGKAKAARMKELGVELSIDAPIYKIDGGWYGSDDPIPAIWITERVVGDDGELLGRTYEMIYPSEWCFDPCGSKALDYGARYYREGMSLASAGEEAARIDCFCAAEILYLHAASKGNVRAFVNLGYLYSYNRCEDQFFVDYRHAENIEDYLRPYPRETRAFECFSRAAESKDPEACYKLGDLYAQGQGCPKDERAAYQWYVRAYDLGMMADSYIWGSAALRLGRMLENGIGCSQNAIEALARYNEAENGLEMAIASGEIYYAGALEEARSAIERLKLHKG